MSVYIIIEPETNEDLAAYYQLRYEVLRKPWNQPEFTTSDQTEANSIHVMMKDENGKTVAAGRLLLLNSSEGQLRSMAVHENYRGQGLGSKILRYIETKAKENNLSSILLDARATAVHFYEKHGYAVYADSYVLFGVIPHFKMKKNLFGGSI